MRQAGLIAAAGLYALQNNIDRLARDHENAAFLTEELSKIQEIEVLPFSGITNMVFLRLRTSTPPELSKFLEPKGILVRGDRNPIRLVTHLDVDRGAAASLIAGIKEFFRGQ